MIGCRCQDTRGQFPVESLQYLTFHVSLVYLCLDSFVSFLRNNRLLIKQYHMALKSLEYVEIEDGLAYKLQSSPCNLGFGTCIHAI